MKRPASSNSEQKKKRKRDDVRVSIVLDIKKGRLGIDKGRGIIKYFISESKDKHYIIGKLGERCKEKILSHPFPSEVSKLASGSLTCSDSINILDELRWYFDIIELYINEIVLYLKIREQLECLILSGDCRKGLDVLDDLEAKIGLSYFIIQSEFYLNEKLNRSEDNKDLIKEFSQEEATGKLILMLEFSRLRIDKKISTWQYSLILEQHKKLYSKEYSEYIDYVIFKLDPVFFEEIKSNVPFIAHYDSDFSIVDRYETLKKILPLVLQNDPSDEVKTYLLEKAVMLVEKTEDKYWEKLSSLLGGFTFIKTEREHAFNEVYNAFLLEDWDKVINRSKELFRIHPNYSELYIPFVESIILKKVDINAFIPEGTELNSILSLVKSVLEKKDSYQSDKEKLLKKYYEACHFDFSHPLLEFIYSEYYIEVAPVINLFSYLNSYVYEPNFIQVASDNVALKRITNIIDKESSIDSILSSIVGGGNVPIYSSELFKNYILMRMLYRNNEYEKIIDLLYEFKNHFRKLLKNESVYTWLIKNSLICYQKLKQHDKAAELVVNYYFEKSNIYDHFFQEDLVEDLIDLDGENIYKNIAIPILFQLFKQPQSVIYDGIANFLIQNDANVPSDLISHFDEFEIKRLIFFFEKVCITDNIESSPFINSIEALEEERIKILNFLKEINFSEKESYNEEILEIVKQASIRKGLQQIHESRIFVDTQNIEKKVESELKEIFDRYLELTDIKYVDLSSLSLEKLVDVRDIRTTFYFIEPVTEKNYYPIFGKNAVTVPYLRYQYFVNLFTILRNHFVFDEDFGFKSFLSMRIRHGTFPNVLRSVFENNHLISSKLNHTTEYNDIEYWKTNLRISNNDKTQEKLQQLLKEFSEKVDDKIDLGLKWISVKNEESVNGAMFDFDFHDFDLQYLFQHRVGRISDFKEFMNEIFMILFERLDLILKKLKVRITGKLSNDFVLSLDHLQKEVELLQLPLSDHNIIIEYIIKCRTDIQVKLQQVEKWFNVSKNKYIEEFPIEMILDTSRNYINSINANALEKATINTVNTCDLKFKGKYFESFGDIFINIFSNIIKYNKDLKENLVIDINIASEKDELTIYVKNNLSSAIDYEHLRLRIEEVNAKIENYKNGTIISYEDKSGYPKICKCISVDLNRDRYVIRPKCTPENFEVDIKFNTSDLSR